MRVIINRNQNTSFVDGIYRETNAAQTLINEALKKGTAIKLVDTDETIMYEISIYSMKPKLYSVKIVTGEKQSLAKCVYFKKDLTFQLVTKWEWYFKYIEAKTRLENPRYYTDLRILSYDAPQHTVEQLEQKRKQNIIQAAKGKVTKIQNRINEYKTQYNSLFPIQEDDIYLQLTKALAKAMNNLYQLTGQNETIVNVKEILTK